MACLFFSIRVCMYVCVCMCTPYHEVLSKWINTSLKSGGESPSTQILLKHDGGGVDGKTDS